MAAGAVPVMGPERRVVERGVVGFGRYGLTEPVRLLAAVGAPEDHEIAANQLKQVTEQGRRQSFGRGFATVIADDPGQRVQVPSAGCNPALHRALLPRFRLRR